MRILFLLVLILVAGDAHALPLRLRSNKPFVPVSVSRSAPQWFILDSGNRGNSILAREAADRLGIALGGDESAQVGAGAGASVRLATAKDPLFLEALGETLSVGEPVVMSLGHVARLEGQRVDGLLGFDFLSRHAVTLDYARSEIVLEDPASYAPPPGAIVVPLELDTGWPIAAGTITTAEGRTLPCRFLVDTGVRFTVAMFRPFSRRHALAGTIHDAVIGYGVGGASRGDLARIAKLGLGGFSVERPVAVFSRDTTGIFALDGPDGILGGELLKRARTTFDYAHARMVLEPYATGAPFEFDMSGLFLEAEPPAFTAIRVLAVNADTPAAAAGLRAGDRLVTLDGKARSLDETRERLRTPGPHRLELERDGETLRVQLEARRLV